MAFEIFIIYENGHLERICAIFNHFALTLKEWRNRTSYKQFNSMKVSLLSLYLSYY